MPPNRPGKFVVAVWLFRGLCKPVIECITGAPDRAYWILFAGGVEQFAQAPDMHIDSTFVDIDIAALDAVEQLLAAEYPSRMFQKKFQQTVLGRPQLDRAA